MENEKKSGRRQLVAARRYNRMKKRVSNPEGVGGKSGKIVGDQMIANKGQGDTSEVIAKQTGLDSRNCLTEWTPGCSSAR